MSPMTILLYTGDIEIVNAFGLIFRRHLYNYDHKLNVIMKRSYQNIHASQEKKARRNRNTSLLWWVDPSPIIEFRHKPKKLLKSFPVSALKILNQLIKYSKEYKQVFVSQGRIGRDIGNCRETVNRSLRYLEESGIVFSNYRHFHTNTYRLTSILKSKRVINKLSSLLPALLIGLFPNVTQSNSSLSNSLNITKSFNVISSEMGFQSPTERMTLQNLRKYGEQAPKYPLPVCLYQKERSMKDVKEAIEVVETNVPLTLYGKSWLSVFPSEVIREAHRTLLDFLKKGKAITNPFGLIFSCCRKICKERKISPEWKTHTRLVEKHSLKSGSPVVTSSKMINIKRERPSHGAYRIFNSKEEPSKPKMSFEDGLKAYKARMGAPRLR